jgi:hypothetical protein
VIDHSVHNQYQYKPRNYSHRQNNLYLYSHIGANHLNSLCIHLPRMGSGHIQLSYMCYHQILVDKCIQIYCQPHCMYLHFDMDLVYMGLVQCSSDRSSNHRTHTCNCYQLHYMCHSTHKGLLVVYHRGLLLMGLQRKPTLFPSSTCHLHQ